MEKKGPTDVGTKVGKGWELRISQKYGHICVGFFLIPFPTCPRLFWAHGGGAKQGFSGFIITYKPLRDRYVTHIY